MTRVGREWYAIVVLAIVTVIFSDRNHQRISVLEAEIAGLKAAMAEAEESQ